MNSNLDQQHPNEAVKLAKGCPTQNTIRASPKSGLFYTIVFFINQEKNCGSSGLNSLRISFKTASKVPL
jgi:hypothetical protein